MLYCHTGTPRMPCVCYNDYTRQWRCLQVPGQGFGVTVSTPAVAINHNDTCVGYASTSENVSCPGCTCRTRDTWGIGWQACLGDQCNSGDACQDEIRCHLGASIFAARQDEYSIGWLERLADIEKCNDAGQPPVAGKHTCDQQSCQSDERLVPASSRWQRGR